MDAEKFEVMVKTLGVGVQDLLGELPEEYQQRKEFLAIGRSLISNIQLVYKLQKIYRNAVKAFFQYVSLNKYPATGFFDTFYHDENKGKNYYCVIGIMSTEPVEQATFTVSFTLAEQIRVDYGEITVDADSVTAYQYFQQQEIVAQRPTEPNCIAKFTTWFGEESCLFIVRTERVRFKLEVLGKRSEQEICQADDTAAFWKTVVCNRYRTRR